MRLKAVNALESEAFASLLLRLRAKALDESLLAALGATPRPFFAEMVDDDYVYHNRVVPIECGEYIERIDEQMAILAALKLDKNHKVLEIGTGSGFSAALMAHMAARVTTIERYKTLIDKAQVRFQQLARSNIIVHHGDAYHGLPAHHGAFDRIIIWPSWEISPQLFIDRLGSNGLLIVPIGMAEQPQLLTCIHKTGSRLTSSVLFPVHYQPMLNGQSQFL